MRTILLAMMLVAGPALGAGLDEARALLDGGEAGQAREILEEAIEVAATRADGLLLLTRACNQLEDYEAGVRYGKQAVEELPRRSEAHHRYAEALRIKMSNGSKMKAMFTIGPYKKALARAIELDPQNADARQEQIGFLMMAPRIAGGDTDKARGLIDELEAIDWRKAMEMKAQLAFKEKRGEDGSRILQQIIEKHPDDIGSRFSLGYWYQRNERYEEADREFAKIAEHERPRYALGGLYQRARTRILGGYELETAIAYLTEYLERFPESASGLPGKSSAHRRLGNAHEGLGDAAKARAAYETALRLDGDNEQAKKGLARLKSR